MKTIGEYMGVWLSFLFFVEGGGVVFLARV